MKNSYIKKQPEHDQKLLSDLKSRKIRKIKKLRGQVDITDNLNKLKHIELEKIKNLK